MSKLIKEKLKDKTREEILDKHIKLIEFVEEIYDRIDKIDLDCEISDDEERDSYNNYKQEWNEKEIKQILFEIRIALS